MRVVRTVAAMQRLARSLRSRGRVGFVPTMGFLHEGHLSLVRAARRRCDSVVVSIFVNPTQFGPGEDLRRYPRDFARDRGLLREAGTDVIFCPDTAEMYPAGHATYVEVERLTRHLCGASRAGHFRGVTTVVAKLLNIVMPNIAVFGQKDAQQAYVIRRMVRDLSFDSRVLVMPTVREPGGLAMSSRNSYLTEEQRSQASVLFRSLELAQKLVRQGERRPARIEAEMRKLVANSGSGRVDYIELTDTDELRPVRTIRGEVLVALAVFFGRTRLIDNTILRV